MTVPAQAVLQAGVTVTVTSTGLDSFPPQSVATTDTTCRTDSLNPSLNIPDTK